MHVEEAAVLVQKWKLFFSTVLAFAVGDRLNIGPELLITAE